MSIRRITQTLLTVVALAAVAWFAPESSDTLAAPMMGFIPVVGDLSRRLRRAYRALEKRDTRGAVGELRYAVTWLRDRRHKSADPESAMAVATAAERLTELCTLLERGGRVQPQDLLGAMEAAHEAEVDELWPGVPSSVWFPLSDRPNEHFRLAHSHLIGGQTNRAAAELRKAAALVRLEASRARPSERDDLLDCTEQLRAMASSIRRADPAESNRMRALFGKTHRALARHWIGDINPALVDDCLDEARCSLLAACRSMQWGFRWLSREVPRSVDSAIGEASDWARELERKEAESEKKPDIVRGLRRGLRSLAA